MRRNHKRKASHRLNIDAAGMTRALASDHDQIVAQVQAHIDRVVSIISKHHPVDLLMKCHMHVLQALNGQFVESKMGIEELVAMRLPEYVQSVIVSTPPGGGELIDSEAFKELLKTIRELYELLTTSYSFSVQARRQQEQGGDLHPLDQVWFFHHMRWLLVRGDRYIERDFEFLREFLSSQSPLLQQQFGLSSEDVVSGIEKLYYVQLEGVNAILGEQHDLVQEYVLHHEEITRERQRIMATLNANEQSALPPLEDELRKAFHDLEIPRRQADLFERLFDGSLLDVVRVTGWPEAFVDALAYAPGQDTSFMTGDRPGWPTKLLPIMKKPFLKDAGRYYLFEYITFFDHIFHNLRDATTQGNPKIEQKWKDNEKDDTERTTLETLGDILPGAVKLGTFYYEYVDDAGKPGFAEADGLFLYARHLLLVEVKGGRASHRPPEGAVLSYLKGVEKLVTAPVEQAERFLQELHRTGTIVLMDKHRKPLMTLGNRDFDHTYVITTMLEHLGEYTANVDGATTLRVAQKGLPVWSISIDDLRVVRDLVEGPAEFLHFLDQRMVAHTVPQFALTDELEHFALYLNRNMYAQLDKEEGAYGKLFFGGLKDEIDAYYRRMKMGENPNPKPRQPQPALYAQLVRNLSSLNEVDKIRAAKFLLDFGEAARNGLSQGIAQMLVSQQQDNRVKPLHLGGEAPLTIFAFTPGLARGDFIDPLNCRRYTLGVMKALGDAQRLMLIVAMDEAGSMTEVQPLFLTQEDIDSEPADTLDPIAEQFKRMHPQQASRRVGRNDLCPCGSGRKYKRCHGRTK